MSEERTALPLGERRLSERHKTLLQRKYGIPPELAERAGLFTVPDGDGVYRLAGTRPRSGRGGIAIPYPGEPDGYARIRLDEPEGGMKYVSPRRGGCRLYVPPGADLAAPEVVITEGELKALCAAAKGINCVAVAGIDSWRQRGPLGERLPEAEALLGRLRRDWRGQTVVLVYDSDIGPSHERYDAFPRLAEQLYRMGADLVKVVTLPPLDAAPGEKVGLDDFVLKYERAGEDGAGRLRALMAAAPPWLPTADGARPFAERILADPEAPLERVKLALAALIISNSEAEARRALDARFADRAMRAALWRDAKGVLEEALRRQGMRGRADGGRRGRGEEEGGDEAPPRPSAIAEAFPPARDVLPEGFPFPETGKKRTFYDIRDGRILKIQREDDYEDKKTVADTVILLKRRLVPLEGEDNEELWEVVWWESGGWRPAKKLLADSLFDAGQRKWLIRAGVPASSANAEELAGWLHAMRCQAVFRGTPLPTARLVDRCGWHLGGKVFVFGYEVLTPQGGCEADGAAAAPQEDGGGEEITWGGHIGDMERQILASFGAGGDPRRHREFLLEMVLKYPQAAFGVGCACAAPLIALLREAPTGRRMDLAGFTVMMSAGRGQGRSRHQGKTCWNRIVAGLYGWPEKDPRGRLRFADRTRAALAILYGTSCDLPVHIEDAQLIVQDRKKSAADELDWLLQLTSGGMDRERAGKSGGGRKTRYFRTVAFWTSEVDLTRKIRPGSGSADRIVRLPPLLPVESPANREEAERIEKESTAHYGHCGREYLLWLLRRLNEDREGFLAELGRRHEAAVDALRRRIPPESPAHHSLARVAKSVGLGLVGLGFLLEALGAGEETARAALRSFARGWEMAAEGAPEEDLASRALEAVQDFVAANAEAIRNLGGDPERPPREWLGARTEVDGAGGRKVPVVALTESAFARAVSREPFSLDPDQALEAMAGAGMAVTHEETWKTADGKTKRTVRTKVRVRLGDTRVWAVCVPLELLGWSPGGGGAAEEGAAGSGGPADF